MRFLLHISNITDSLSSSYVYTYLDLKISYYTPVYQQFCNHQSWRYFVSQMIYGKPYLYALLRISSNVTWSIYYRSYADTANLLHPVRHWKQQICTQLDGSLCPWVRVGIIMSCIAWCDSGLAHKGEIILPTNVARPYLMYAVLHDSLREWLNLRTSIIWESTLVSEHWQRIFCVTLQSWIALMIWCLYICALTIHERGCWWLKSLCRYIVFHKTPNHMGHYLGREL